MTAQEILPILKHLYEGKELKHLEVLHDGLVFQDPAVIVEGRAKVQTMFRRLNSLFPHTEIIELKQRDTNPTSFDLTVTYRRRSVGRTRPFKTQLHCHFSGNRLKRLTEHWYGPMKLSGGKNALLGTTLRRITGRLTSLG